MDPLSISAAITGLAGAIASVYKSISTISSAVKNLPREIQALLTEVNELEWAVEALRTYVQNTSEVPRRRAFLVSIDQVIATLTEVVLTISDAEALLKPIDARKTFGEISIRDKLRFTLHQGGFNTVIQRLQRNKTSLNLMFNVFQCGSDKEAANSQHELKTLVADMLETNKDLCRRLESMEEAMAARSRLHSAADSMNLAQDDSETIRSLSRHQNIGSYDYLEKIRIPTSFENVLEATRVYKRAIGNECDISLRTSYLQSRAWSQLSDLSLAQISNISVVALPLYQSDISNGQWYTFGDTREISFTEGINVTQEFSLGSTRLSQFDSSLEIIPSRSSIIVEDASLKVAASVSGLYETLVGEKTNDYTLQNTSRRGGTAMEYSWYEADTIDIDMLDPGETAKDDENDDNRAAKLRTCTKCDNNVVIGFEIGGFIYHDKCFLCVSCDVHLAFEIRPLDPKLPHSIDDSGRIKCSKCWSSTCTACGKKIPSLARVAENRTFCGKCFLKKRGGIPQRLRQYRRQSMSTLDMAPPMP